MNKETVIKSSCWSCHGGCNVLLHVKDGVITRVAPDPDGPINKGRLCIKGISARELLYHPDRIRHPMKRAGKRGEGKWEQISWDEAYDIIVENINKTTELYGREGIALAMGTGRHHFNSLQRFANTIGTPNWIEPGWAQCYYPRIVVSSMTLGGLHVPDYFSGTYPEVILVWGHNHEVSGTGAECTFSIKDAEKAGSRFIVIDSRRIPLAERADLWLQPRPGTDCALALGMLNVIINEQLYDKCFVEKYCYGFEKLKERVQEYPLDKVSGITWVPEEKIRCAARMFAEAKTASLEWGLAMEHTINCIQTVRSVCLLPTITGNLEIPGGWVMSPMKRVRPGKNAERLSEKARRMRMGCEEYKLCAGMEAISPSAHIPTLFNAMITGDPYPVKMLMLFGNNGLVSFADSARTYKAYSNMDFICCADRFLTPTAEMADLILPAATWMEIHELMYMPSVLGIVQPGTQVAECKADEDMFLEICQRLGEDWGASSNEELYNEAVRGTVKANHLADDSYSLEDLKRDGYLTAAPRFRFYETEGFQTPTGKAELYCTTLEKLGYDPLPFYREPSETPYSAPDVYAEFPLILTTGGRVRSWFNSENRQMPSTRNAHPYPLVDIHPDTAAKYGIEDGNWVNIESPRGRITQKAHLTDGIDPRVINCEYGWWYPEIKTPDHGVWISNVNVLTSMEPPFDPAMGTYHLRGLLCRISKNNDMEEICQIYPPDMFSDFQLIYQ